jgi:hypothetical protein
MRAAFSILFVLLFVSIAGYIISSAGELFLSPNNIPYFYNNSPQPTISNRDYYKSEEYRKTRVFESSWYENNNPSGRLKPNADENGVIIDFVIAGFPKMGTTTLMANLGHLAPMPVADICTPASKIVYYPYHGWSDEFDLGKNMTLRGSKCPAYIDGGFLSDYSTSLPKTLLIIGIRHPILWYQSFHNMQAGRRGVIESPYEKMAPCKTRGNGKQTGDCRNGCPARQFFCMDRARFHLPLARLGKTSLTDIERTLLAPLDWDGGERVVSNDIRNPVFLYEQTQLRDDALWKDLAVNLGVPEIKNNRRYSSNGGKGKTEGLIDICDSEFDNFRCTMMLFSYDLSVWLLDYFIPVAKNESRPDVVIGQIDSFIDKVKDYKLDPCRRLVRLDNGTYVLPSN